jgi:DNA-binding transcriptional LysR family regulator
MSNFKNVQRKLSWDDLRFVLAVARSGSLTHAAIALKVSHPTVFRRVRAIELALGVRLFERDRSGYTPTDAAAELVALAEQIDADIGRVELSVAGLDERPSGIVRITSTDTLVHELLTPLWMSLRTTLPLITLEISTSNALMNLTKREADVALRPGGAPPEHLIGKRVCALESTIYRPAGWADVSVERVHEFAWVAPDDSLSHLASSRWLVERRLASKVVLRANSQQTLVDAVSVGVGLAVLPCYVGDRAPALRRVCAPIKQFRSDLWLLYHPELRRVRRIQSVVEALHRLLLEHKELLEGGAPYRPG